MSVSYAPTKIRVPLGFEHILEGLAREVLREQPEDIITFAAEYFKKKLLLRNGELMIHVKHFEHWKCVLKYKVFVLN